MSFPTRRSTATTETLGFKTTPFVFRKMIAWRLLLRTQKMLFYCLTFNYLCTTLHYFKTQLSDYFKPFSYNLRPTLKVSYLALIQELWIFSLVFLPKRLHVVIVRWNHSYFLAVVAQATGKHSFFQISLGFCAKMPFFLHNDLLLSGQVVAHLIQRSHTTQKHSNCQLCTTHYANLKEQRQLWEFDRIWLHFFLPSHLE